MDNYEDFDPSFLFQKMKQIKFRDDDFVLPDPENFYTEGKWEIAGLLDLKNSLNEAKSLLDGLELASWHKHTRTMNKACLILPTVRNEFDPEFCTWAWCKFTECLHSYRIIPGIMQDLYKEGFLSQISSIHLCEVPGAFVSATNQFFAQNMPDLKWNWLATSLSPYFEGNTTGEMINEDKLILNSWRNWTFLKDLTGNILLEDNIRHLTEIEVNEKKMENVQLVTADGSIDCQNDPAEQENLVAHLHLAEVITALRILAPGGSFVLKIFTFLEYQTICHLYFLASTFREVHLFKPVSSKEGNSEVYVICLGYVGRGKIQKELDVLLSSIEHIQLNNTRSLLPLKSLHPMFLDRIQDAAAYFTGTQISIIKRNLANFPPSRRTYRKIRQRQLSVLEMFLDKYHLIRLNRRNSLFKAMKHKRALTSSHVGPVAFTKPRRTWYTNGTFDENLTNVAKNIDQYVSTASGCQLCIELEKYGGPVCVLFGRPYVNIRSSRFCYSQILGLREELRTLLISQRNELHEQIKAHRCADREKLCCATGLIKQQTHRTSILCFHKNLDDFLYGSDMEHRRNDLNVFFNYVQAMNTGHSIYLCEFSLLSRLHVGLIFLAARFFSKVWILLDASSQVQGIYLFDFQGMMAFKQRSLGKTFSEIHRFIQEGNPQQCILEVVDMRYLCSSKHWHAISTYNMYGLGKSLREFIATAKTCSLTQ